MVPSKYLIFTFLSFLSLIFSLQRPIIRTNHLSFLRIMPLYSSMVAEPQPNVITRLPRVEFQYCTGCKWLLRSAWLAQELLQTFQESLGEVALIPENNIGGTFIVRLNGNVIWDRKDEKTPGFPEAKQLKQIIRDIIEPEKKLGHSDIKPNIMEVPPEN